MRPSGMASDDIAHSSFCWRLCVAAPALFPDDTQGTLFDPGKGGFG